MTHDIGFLCRYTLAKYVRINKKNMEYNAISTFTLTRLFTVYEYILSVSDTASHLTFRNNDTLLIPIYLS